MGRCVVPAAQCKAGTVCAAHRRRWLSFPAPGPIFGGRAPVAQLAEQGTLNPKVEGSIPSRCTRTEAGCQAIRPGTPLVVTGNHHPCIVELPDFCSCLPPGDSDSAGLSGPCR